LKKTFVFTGGEIVREFLVSSSYLPGAHDHDCPVYWQIARLQPPWTKGMRNVELGEHDDEPSHTE
jgi:DNA-3-methyladenine glycosylase I